MAAAPRARARVHAPVTCLLAVLVAGGGLACGGPTRMGGFPEREARASMIAESVDGCTVRIGQLILETEEVLIREYPHYGANAGRHFEEPMLLTVLSAPGAAPGDETRAGELVVHEAPTAYRPGERVARLEGVRLLDRPLGALRGHRLILRLAENDRTEAPHWARVGKTASAASAAVSLVGAPSPAGLLGEAVDLLRQLDEDDLILIADLDLDAVAALVRPAVATTEATARQPAVRLRFATARRVGAGAGQPSAEMVLLAHREPEPGCP